MRWALKAIVTKGRMEEFVRDVADIDFTAYAVHIKHGVGDEARSLLAKIDALKQKG